MRASEEKGLENRSITWRLTASLVITILVVSAIAVAAMHQLVSAAAMKSLEQKADETLAYLVGTLDTPLWTVDHDQIKTIGDAASRDESMAQLIIKNDSGAVIYSNEKERGAGLLTRSAKTFHKQGNLIESTGEVDISLTPRTYQSANDQLFLFSAAIIVVILMSVGVVTVFFIRTALNRPLNSLSEIADRFASGSYDLSARSVPYLEFQPFAKALVQMASKLEGQIRTIKDAEAKYRDIFEHAIEGIVQSTMDGRVVSANPALAKIVGYDSPDDLLAAMIDIPNDIYVSHQERDKLLSMLLEHNAVTSFEVQFRRKDKQVIWVSLSARLVRSDAGVPLYIEALITDISERKRADEALRRLNRELRAISICNQALMHAEDETALLNEICGIVCNEAGYRMAWVGYGDDDRARTARPVAWAGAEDGHFEQPGFTWTAMANECSPCGTALASGASVCIQDYAAHANAADWHDAASQRQFRSSISLPLKNESAVTFGVFNIYSAEADAFTQDEMRLLEQLAADLAFGITALRDRIERRRIEKIEKGRLRLLEFAGSHSMDQLLTATLDEIEALTGSAIGFYHFVEPDQQTLALQNWSTNTLSTLCKAEGKGSHYDLAETGAWVDCVHERRTIIHNDYASLPHRKGLPEGHAPVIREVVVPIMRGGKIKAIVGVGNKPVEYDEGDVENVSKLADLSWDIVERKRAEDEVSTLNRELERRVDERTTELESVNKELEAFSYSVSHDLRTPLRAIDGFSHILLCDYADALDAEGKRLLNVVRDNTRRMGKLIDDILDFSRSGRVGINASEIDMADLAHSVFNELKPDADSGKLQLKIDAMPHAIGDSVMLRQVFVNLLSNAIKFSRPKEIAKIEVGGRIEGGEAIYFVKDNGVGFDMRYADKLFGVFSRLHAVTEFEGTGIGLAIVKRIVTRHGGRVWAESKVDEGTTIYFALPAREAAHAADCAA